jgi:hypothetical protein
MPTIHPRTNTHTSFFNFIFGFGTSHHVLLMHQYLPGFYAFPLQSSMHFMSRSLFFLVVVRIVSLTFTFGDTFSFGIHLTFSRTSSALCSHPLLTLSTFVCALLSHFQMHPSFPSSYFRFLSPCISPLHHLFS